MVTPILNPERDLALRLMADAQPHIVWMCDARGEIAFVNRTYREFFGVDEETVRGRGWLGVVHPDDRERYHAAWLRCVERRARFHEPVRVRRADGAWRWVDSSARPVYEGDTGEGGNGNGGGGGGGAFLGFVGTSPDITERIEAEAALRASRERLELVARAASDAIYEWDIPRARLTWNEGLRSLFGYRPEEVPTTLDWWEAQLHPADRERIMAGLTAAVEGGVEMWRAGYRFRRADGSYADLSDRGYFVRDPAGRAVLMIGAMQDLSERVRSEAALRESEERFRTLFDSIDEGFCIVEMLFDGAGRAFDFTFLEANPAFVRQTGLSDVVGRRMRELRPDHEESWFETFGRVAVTGEPVRFEKEARALERWYDVYAFRTGEPAERRVAILFNDITGRRRAEQGLVRSNQELQRFASIASHDLKEPLRGVATLASLMLEDERGLSAEGRTRLARMAQLCGRLTAMIEGLLEYARSGGRRRDEACDLSDLARRAVDKLAEGLRAGGAEVVVQPGLPTIRGDPVMLERMFANLVGNALRHARATRVEIGAEPAEGPAGGRGGGGGGKGGGGTTIYIRDNGVGIDPRHHERIFGLLARIPGRVEPPAGATGGGGPVGGGGGGGGGGEGGEDGGIGLGLALVKLIAESHGGRVWVRSAVGEGATFYLKFPGR